MRDFAFDRLARCHPSALQCAATIRAEAEHFQVEEQLPFVPSGDGGHVWLKLRKKDMNTDWLAKLLAEFAKVPQLDVGYAGLKDRHAVTTQWFSIKVEGKTEPDWQQFAPEGVTVLEQTRHNKKLKRGVLTGNVFNLTLTELNGEAAAWQSALERVQQAGVPNYFGEQRFGMAGGNLVKVDAWFSGAIRRPKQRHQRSLYLSAARSWLFNLVLSQRVEQANWDRYLAGDMMLLSGTKGSVFKAEADDAELLSRLAKMDIHPTGPLCGRGVSAVTDACSVLEQAVLSDWLDWQIGLEKAGLEAARRALRVMPEQFRWQWPDDQRLQLQFFLPAGSYATAVLRELAVINDASHQLRS